MTESATIGKKESSSGSARKFKSEGVFPALTPAEELKRYELNYHPGFCYLGIFFTLFTTWYFFKNAILNPDVYYFLPIALLIGFYTLISVLTDRKVYQKRTIEQVLFKAVPKFVVWGLALKGVYWVYSTFPLYSNYYFPSSWTNENYSPKTCEFVGKFLHLYYWAGLPYFILEEKFRGCADNYLGDPYIRLNILVKRLFKLDFSGFARRLWNTRNRRSLLSWMIRIHYTPVMVEQVHYRIMQLNWQCLNWEFLHTVADLATIVFIIETLCWLIDSNNASIGYFWQSSFTRSRFRDMDPNPFHWIITLACYPPFILFVSSWFVEFPGFDYSAPLFFKNERINQFIDWGILISLVGYMLSTTALAFSFSNLAYKKIQTKGPYGIVRHPATGCKIFYFSLCFFKFAGAYHWGWFLCWGFWMGIYIGRALVEERYLRKFPEYQIYMQKTRYRFFPGIA